MTSLIQQSLAIPHAVADIARDRAISALDTSANVVEKIHNIYSGVPTRTEKEIELGLNEYQSGIAKELAGLRDQLKRGFPITLSLEKAAALVDALIADKTGKGLDDRLMLLEFGLVLLSRLPPTPFQQKLTNKVIAMLYNDLAHPPSTLIGTKYRYRSADGAGNNIFKPDIGKANTPYARSVQDLHPLPANQLPSPELLFDVLLKREGPVEHPGGLSSHFFAFANLVIHSLFHTDHQSTEGINKTSSYLDLSPIYGNSQEEQDSVRLHDGTGCIYPDTFADSRLLRMPPSTPALLVLFSRNHNYICRKLLAINERGTFVDPPPQDDDKKKAQDEDLFQTARLINCGFFMTVILSDYLAAILGLVREGNSWSLNPLESFRNADHVLSERGQGNQVSAEFTALYHFHSSISVADEAWTEDEFRRLFGSDIKWDDITVELYKDKLRQLGGSLRDPPNEWVFGNLVRDADGKFKDDDLAKLLHDATQYPASAFKARGTPHVMRIIEIMGIQQNRDWGTCSLNAFRKFLGLKPFSTFEEWNPRPDIAEAARRLYRHPDNIELYVGLQAEDSKKPVPGAGLCPGYTASRAILADAVALVRGDRFLTNDFTTHNLTSWGFNECKRDQDNSAFGGALGKLLSRTLPNHYPADSVYTLFPFMTPTAMRENLTKLGLEQNYNFDRPIARPPVKVVKSYAQAQKILKSPSFAVNYVERASEVLPGNGYFANFNKLGRHSVDVKVIRQAFTTQKTHAHYVTATVQDLLREKSYTLVGDFKGSVDIVRDVINYLPVRLVSDLVLGLPLKTESDPRGTYYEWELYDKLKNAYNYLYDRIDPTSQIAQADYVQDVLGELTRQAYLHLTAIKAAQLPLIGLPISVGSTIFHVLTGVSEECHRFLGKLLFTGKPIAELAHDAVALAVTISVELAQAMTHVIDSLLSGPHLSTIVDIVTNSSPSKQVKLRQYVVEALRVRPPLPGIYRSVIAPYSSNEVTLSPGDRVYISLTDANLDPAVLQDNGKPRPPPLLGDGIFALLGTDWVVTSIIPVVQAIFALPNVGRAPGNSGNLISFKQDTEKGAFPVLSYLDKNQQPTPWSSSMTVAYNGYIAPQDLGSAKGSESVMGNDSSSTNSATTTPPLDPFNGLWKPSDPTTYVDTSVDPLTAPVSQVAPLPSAPGNNPTKPPPYNSNDIDSIKQPVPTTDIPVETENGANKGGDSALAGPSNSHPDSGIEKPEPATESDDLGSNDTKVETEINSESMAPTGQGITTAHPDASEPSGTGGGKGETLEGSGTSLGAGPTPSTKDGQPKFVISEAVGGQGGSPFDDQEAIPDPGVFTVNAIVMELGEHVDSIRLGFSNGEPGEVHGNSRNMRLSEVLFELEQWDYIIKVTVWAKEYVDAIQYQTIKGHITPVYGNPSGTPIELIAPAGYRLACFKGRSGWTVDNLAAIWTPMTL